MASGVVYAVVSLLLVIGSLTLSLAQGGGVAEPTSGSSALTTAADTRIPDTQSTVADSATAARSPTAAATKVAPTSTYFYPTARTAVPSTATSARACGPFAGWVKGYMVQSGDTLFRIATLHGITVTELQRANCKTGTTIYAGELLWVPFMLPPATELTIIPTFDTPTPRPTQTPSPTAIDTPTDTQIP
jgi:LysM repeat protein